MDPSTPNQTRRESRLSLEDGQDAAPAYGNTPASRRASVASAIGSIQKFKESWMSIMFLKAGVGLGQVIVLIVLLVLASSLDSPLVPGIKQDEASDECPRPVLFQSWMIVQIIRLTVCWSISCWVAVRSNRRERRPRVQEEEVRIENITPPSPAGSVPSLIHSPSSETTVTRRSEYTDIHTTPGRDYAHNMHSSSSSSGSIDMLSMMTLAKQPAGNSMPSTPEYARSRSSHSARNSTLDLARATHLQQSSGPAERRAGFADAFEKIAPKLTKMLGAISFVLFILGNVLLFYPPPTQQQTCYHASPMLWWGVMTVTGVGWFLFGQIVVVVLIIGVGGPAILTSLRRLPCFPTPVEPEPARAPQPAPLTATELAKLPIVCYIPSEDTEKSEWDPSRFPYPAHPLATDQAMCAICQENYTEPEVVRRVLYQADPLRLLGCGHLYHVDCIDKWLTEKSSICPYCNRCVRQTSLKVESDCEHVTAKRWWRREVSA